MKTIIACVIVLAACSGGHRYDKPLVFDGSAGDDQSFAGETSKAGSFNAGRGGSAGSHVVPPADAGEGGADFAGAGTGGDENEAGMGGDTPVVRGGATSGSGGSSGSSSGGKHAGGAAGTGTSGSAGSNSAGSSSGSGSITGGTSGTAGAAGTMNEAGSAGSVQTGTCSADDRSNPPIAEFTYVGDHQNTTCETQPAYDPTSFPSVIVAYEENFNGGVAVNGGCNFVGHIQTDNECASSYSYKCCYAPTGSCFDEGATLTIDVMSIQDDFDGSSFSGTITVQDGCTAVYSFVANR